MSKAFLLIFTFLVFAPLQAQPLPERAPIRGTVVDESGRPLEGVSLSIRRESSAGSFGFWGGDAQSDASGAFVFPNAEEGAYALGAEMSGFAPVTNSSVKWTRQSAPLRLQLQRLVRLRARFLAPDGTALTSANVLVHLRSVARENVTRRVRTDAQGNALLGEIAPGQTAIWARAESGIALLPPRNLSSTNAQIEIPLQRGAVLRARVQDAAGRALGGATLLSLAPESPATRAAWSEASGTEIVSFVSGGQRLNVTSRDGDGALDVPLVLPGRYLVAFAGQPGASDTPRVVEVVEGENAVQTWTLAPPNGVTLTLDVRTRDDQSVREEIGLRLVQINANGTLGGGSEPFTALGPPVRRAVPDERGRVQLFPIAPARYRIWASRRAQNGETAARESSPVDVDVSTGGATATLILP